MAARTMDSGGGQRLGPLGGEQQLGELIIMGRQRLKHLEAVLPQPNARPFYWMIVAVGLSKIMPV